jgi:hypothetical protein
MTNKLGLNFLLGTLLIILSSCNPLGKDRLKVEFKNPNMFRELKSAVTSVSIVNHQLIITGSLLSEVKTATLKNDDQEEIFKVESATENKIIANGTKAITLLAGKTMSLILADAYGQAVFQVSFDIVDGSVTTSKLADASVTATKLSSMGAIAGQFLKFDGTTWVASSMIEGQNYLGTWNATANTPDLSIVSSSSGDYYIVDVAGAFNSVTYSIGDWIISDGYNWQKIAYSKTSVASFQGRKGAVTLIPADYVSFRDTGTQKITGSKLSDIADLNLAGLANGQILKWNAGTSTWLPSADLSGAMGLALTDLSASAPLTYNSATGVFGIAAATTIASGSLSSTDKTKLDGLTAIPTTGDGLLERFSGILAMKTCAAGEMLIWNSVSGWTCSVTVILSGTTAQTLGMARNTTSNTAGNNLTIEASGATSAATDKAGGNLVLSSGTSTGTGSSSIQFQTAKASVSGTTDNAASTKMTILGDGNVGIGILAPISKIHSYENNSSTGNSNGITIEQAGAGDSLVHFLLTAVQRWTMGIDNSDGDKFKIGTSSDLGSSNVLTLLNSGYVGIGTSAPTSLLHTVAGGAKTSNYSGNLLTNTATSSTASINKQGKRILISLE